MLKRKQLEYSTSNYNSATLIVPKKNNKYQWPLESIPIQLEKLAGCRYYVSIDLKDSFFQVGLKKESRKYTSFECPGVGKLQYTCVPQGMKNSSVSLSKVVSTALYDIDWAVQWIDDICFGANNLDELLKKLEIILQRLGKVGLKISPEKTIIGCQRLIVLGNVVDYNGISIDKERYKCIQNYPRPTNVTELRSWLGLCNWVRRHIKDYARISHPLSSLTGGKKKDKILWNQERINAFENMKKALITTALSQPKFSNDPEEKFILSVDSCNISEGMTFLQRQYNNETKKYDENVIEKQYAISEKECHAIYYFVTEIAHRYVHGQKRFIVRTDHKPLLALKTKKMASSRLNRWAVALGEYQMDIEHIDGSKHEQADIISRLGYLLLENQNNIDEKVEVLMQDINL
eukprot:Pgem_evm4s18099